jgi:hypothetical protein
MAFLPHAQNRSWLAFAVIAGTMWAIADSSTRGTMGGVHSTVASDITDDRGGAPSDQAQAPAEHRHLSPASALADGSGSPVRVAGSRRRTIPGSHKRIVMCSATGVAGDPNDDGTSGDPDEDDDNETSKFLNSDNNTEVACMVWLQEMVPYLIADHCATLTGPAQDSSHSPMLQPLRC